MFGFLKKKLQESVEKISTALKGTKEEKAEEHLAEQIETAKPEPVVQVPKEEVEIAEEEQIKEEIPHEIPSEVKKEIEQEVKVEAKEHDKEAPKKKGFLEKFGIKRKLKKEAVGASHPISKPKAEIKTEKPKGIIEKLKKAVTEKTIEEADVLPMLEDLQTSLMESDVAFEVAEKITNDLKGALVGKSVPRGKVGEIVKESLKKSILEILSVGSVDIIKLAYDKKPLKIIFLGFNGTGKTTTVARLGYLLKQERLKPIFAAGDTWRAAAQEQLEIHGEKLGIDVIKHKYGADPAAVIFDAVKAAESRKCDVVLADTAGRAHSNKNLMDEMKKIVRVNKPDLKILVVDSLTGNDAVEQAKLFNDAIGIDGIIMTKADVYEKGGALLSAVWTIKKPILYVGIGQDYEDLKEFKPEEIVKNLLG